MKGHMLFSCLQVIFLMYCIHKISLRLLLLTGRTVNISGIFQNIRYKSINLFGGDICRISVIISKSSYRRYPLLIPNVNPCSGDWHQRAQFEQMVLSGLLLAPYQGSGIGFALLSLPLCFCVFLCLASWLLWAADWFCYRGHLLFGLHSWLSI